MKPRKACPEDSALSAGRPPAPPLALPPSPSRPSVPPFRLPTPIPTCAPPAPLPPPQVVPLKPPRSRGHLLTKLLLTPISCAFVHKWRPSDQSRHVRGPATPRLLGPWLIVSNSLEWGLLLFSFPTTALLPTPSLRRGRDSGCSKSVIYAQSEAALARGPFPRPYSHWDVIFLPWPPADRAGAWGAG